MLLVAGGFISFSFAASSTGKLVATSCAGDVIDPVDSDGDTTFKHAAATTAGTYINKY